MADADRNDIARPVDRWAILLDELDRPLMPGFMTAGYTALGRYLYLAYEDDMRHE